MSFNIYGVPPTLTCVLLFILGSYVFLNRNSSPVGLSLATFCFSLCWWLFGYSVMYFMNKPSSGLFWARFGCMGIAFIPVFTFHFIVKFLGQVRPILTKLFYLAAILLTPLVWTPFIYRDIQMHFWGFYPVAGSLYWVLLLTFFITFITGASILFLEILRLKKESNFLRYNQVKYVFIGIMIGCFGVVDYVIKYGIEIYPFGYIAAFIFAGTIVYAIFRHKLLNVGVILKNTLVFAGLLTFTFGVFSAATFLVREVLSARFGVGEFWASFVSIFIIVVGYEPIRKILVNATDQFLFQKKYDYQKFLKDASRGISRIESLRHLLQLVVHFITMRMRVTRAAILSKKEGSAEYVLEYQRGYTESSAENTVGEDSPLIQYLLEESEAVEIEKINEYIDTGGKKIVKGEQPRAYDFEGIKTEMEKLNIVCCVPSFLGKELRNILVLGPKKSGEYYTDEDLNILFTLAQESAIAIENARLFDEAVDKAKELEQINTDLEVARLQLMEALQDTESANKQLQDTQAQLIHEQKMATLGRLAASVGHEVNNPLTILSMNVSRAILKYRKDPELKVETILDIFQKMEQNISRIKAVVNTLTGLLKKSEKGRFEPLSLKLILEETLPLVQFQTYLDNLAGTEVEFNVPGNIPLVRGDLERLQEVFLNLFINAYHAMSGRRNPRIEVRAEICKSNSDVVEIYFKDNGSGMPEEVRKKIFNYGYTTKPPGKGSGLGLYMCKYIIELHGGTMIVESKEGVGTTFILTLPIYDEDKLSMIEPKLGLG